MTGTVYQRCRCGCGLICDHADLRRHEARCTGEARLEDCVRLPYAPVITWHQTNTEETETANLLEDLENLENLHGCVYCLCLRPENRLSVFDVFSRERLSAGFFQ